MKKVILLSVSILLISSVFAFAEVPCKINYQGRLIKDNVPVDGTKTMNFSIYDSAVGPTLLWTSGNVSVEVHNGLFRYVLGTDGEDLSSIFQTAGETLYLEVIVDGETLTPREELSAYPYAINAHLLEGETKEYFLNASAETQTKQGNLNIMGNLGIGTTGPQGKLDVSGKIKEYGNDLLPQGVIVMWAGTLVNIPNGWALCDGGTYTAPNGDPVATPDLRDRFIYACSAGENPGVTGGSTTHTHPISKQYFTYDTIGAFPVVKWKVPILESASEVIINTNWEGGKHEAGNSAESSPTHVSLWGDADTDLTSSLPPYYKLAYIMKL